MDTLEVEQPKYTVVNMVHACEIEAYIVVDGEGTCPLCTTMPNKPRLSIDGKLGLATGIYPEHMVSYLTQSEATVLMQTPEWSTPEELV